MKKIFIGFLAVSLICGSTVFPKKENKKVVVSKKEKRKKKGLFAKLFGKKEKSKKVLVSKNKQKKVRKKKAWQPKEYSWRYKKAEKEKLADNRRRAKKEELSIIKNELTVGRRSNMNKWKKIRSRELSEDYAEGMYADLYKRPAWPFYAWFADNKDLLNVSLKYDYATTAFIANGGTRDLSKLYFGEDDFTFADILLAARLVKNAKAVNSSLVNLLIGADTMRDNKLIFHAKSHGYGASLDFARYIKDTDVLFGFQVPFGYKAHELKLDSDISGFEANSRVRYAISELLDYVLHPKGLSYLPKMSIVGIGDISTFLSMQINTKFVERLIVGLKAMWPTSKDPDTKKLWAPKLGEGFTTISWFGSVLFHKQRSYFNPHMMMEFAYSLPDHKNRRVPKKIINTEIAGDEYFSDTDFAHGKKVKTPVAAGIPFTELDSLIPAFADNVKPVKITQGPQIFVRIGNIIEKFILRRCFMDMFYEFRAKFKDRIGSGLTRDLWNVDVLKEDTHQLEHRIGADFTYQFDAKTRLQTGFKYTFDGINVPELFEFNIDVNVEF